MLPTVMTAKNRAAVALGRIKTPKKAASSAANALKATAARTARQTDEQRREQARRAALAMHRKYKHKLSE
jgi:hypothetical protein